MTTKELLQRTKDFDHGCGEVISFVVENKTKKESVTELPKEAEELTAIFIASRKTASQNHK